MTMQLATVVQNTVNLAPLSTDQVLEQVNLIQQIMRAVMKDGEHYGTIPGCGEKKALLKPGAEKIAMTFRLRPEYDVDVLEIGDGGHREVRVTCTLRTGDGSALGQGVGCCSTMESKYRYRSEAVGRDVPKEYWKNRDPELLGGPEFGYKKSDGKYIVVHRVDVKDIADAYNTVLKMAKKRALVDAVITCTAASDIFVQDIDEDHLARGDDGETETREPVAMPKAKTETTAPQTVTGDVWEGPITVTTKTGTSKNGPWTLWNIAVGENVASTFDSKLGEMAGFLNGSNCRVTTKPGRKPGTIEAVSVEDLGA